MASSFLRSPAATKEVCTRYARNHLAGGLSTRHKGSACDAFVGIYHTSKKTISIRPKYGFCVGVRRASRSPLFSSIANNVDSSKETSECDNVSALLQDAFSTGETDAVQDSLVSYSILQSLLDDNQSAAEDVADILIKSAIEAATSDCIGTGRNVGGLNRVNLAAILNAILASCCERTDDLGGTVALALLEQMDEMHSDDETTMVAPDLVSLSLVYHALEQTSSHPEAQQAILERAQRLAKKGAGSQRRKALAAERRRKPPGSDEGDIRLVEQRLQSLYGSDIHILYQDDDLLIVSKPPGMVCYHNKKTSAGKITTSRKKKSRAANNGKDDGSNDGGDGKLMDISLEDALIDMAFPLSTVNPSARGIVHRLDRGTSGAIVLAKNDETHLRLVASFFLRKATKVYSALVPGSCLQNIDGDEDANVSAMLTIGSEGEIDLPVDRRPAKSKYRVVKMYGHQEEQTQQPTPEAILLEVQTLTGRKHQVRVHCASGLGRPIFLDPLYSTKPAAAASAPKQQSRDKKKAQKGGKETEIVDDEALPTAIQNVLKVGRYHPEQFFLHAKSLSILGVTVDAPFPTWWSDTFDEWELKKEA
ncbi:predicted protein [Thalassiosira pseudonana CCMP1335]|uniref:Pseudouridine synthase RsuA/RluA-like domain-containing protein n=1 Tax=Thalassiosira pseudonana TaxID=35128 RepID=B8LDV9_THAPS|nr:predicted protein [Thalassiosira pseudonana CCMP1335]EED86506.1 predicted protein [Thalassiosira pseudonana CCMP1335]